MGQLRGVAPLKQKKNSKSMRTRLEIGLLAQREVLSELLGLLGLHPEAPTEAPRPCETEFSAGGGAPASPS